MVTSHVGKTLPVLNGQFDRQELQLLLQAIVPGLTPSQRAEGERVYNKIYVLLHGKEPISAPVPIKSRWPEDAFGGREHKNGYWQPLKKVASPVKGVKPTTPTEQDYLQGLASLGITL